MPSVSGIATPSDLPSYDRSPATHNALDFVRALKAPTDPPQPSGPSKIQIAQAAWKNNSFYMPNKAETVVDWILTRLLKDKGKDLCVLLRVLNFRTLIVVCRSANPILDVQYWTLLENVLLSHNDVKVQDKPWLVPLLTRIPITPIVTSFVSLCAQHPSVVAQGLKTAAFRCLSALWPLAATKFSTETLLECFGTLLDYTASHGPTENPANEDFAKLTGLVVSSYRSSLVNASNKKKVAYSASLCVALAHAYPSCTPPSSKTICSLG